MRAALRPESARAVRLRSTSARRHDGSVGGELGRLFMATLGWLLIPVSFQERQADSFEGMNGALLRFGWVPAR
jgi:hypothetical protein